MKTIKKTHLQIHLADFLPLTKMVLHKSAVQQANPLDARVNHG